MTAFKHHVIPGRRTPMSAYVPIGVNITVHRLIVTPSNIPTIPISSRAYIRLSVAWSPPCSVATTAEIAPAAPTVVLADLLNSFFHVPHHRPFPTQSNVIDPAPPTITGGVQLLPIARLTHRTTPANMRHRELCSDA